MNTSTRHIESGDAWDDHYRRYQARLASEYLIPVLESWGVPVAGKRVLEAGSGNGGCAAEFHRAGGLVTAVDIDERLVETARTINEREGLPVTTWAGDVCRPDCAGLDEGPFDIILLRDVVEHLDDLGGALENLGSRLSTDGVLYIVFPPYYSAYGAHQQILPRKRIGPVPYNKLPFIHLLPDRWFGAITRGETPPHHEVARLRKIRLTIRGFNRTATTSGFVIRHRRYYLTRPTHKLRYGIPVVGASVLGSVPLLNELVVTACYCLLDRKKPGA